MNPDKRITERIRLFNLIIQTGMIKFKRSFLSHGVRISYIKAVRFTEQYDFNFTDDDIEKWNEYVRRIRNTIDVKTYCEWIYDNDGNIMGIMSFYDKKNEEIKMKHFYNWNGLIEKIKEKK